MSIEEIKNTLHQLIDETDDINVLIKIKETFFALKSDTISDHEKKMIEKGLEQADKGKLISNDQVRSRIDEWVKSSNDK